MKTKFKRIGRQSVSVILAVMMMLSTMLVGMVTSNAANQDTILYVAYSGDYDVWLENWGGTNNGWYFPSEAVSGKTFDGKQVYSCAVYNDSKGINLHLREKGTTNTKVSLKNIINQEDVNNYTSKIYVVNASSNGGEWVDYTTATNHNVTVNFSNATVTLDGSSVTSGTAVSVTNADTHTLTVTPASGYSLTSVKNGETELGTSGTYTLAIGSEDVNITVTTAKEYEFYLTGYMGSDIGTDKGYKFTKESDGVYTYVITPNGDLYVTITDKNNSTTYMSAGYEELSVNNASSKSVVTSGTSGADKWGIKGQNGKEIKITWDITGGITNGKIKWEYTTSKHNVTVTSSNATVKINDTDVASGSSAQVAENTDFNLKVTPNEGYYITSITVGGKSQEISNAKGENSYNVPMGTADIAVNVQAAQIIKPTATLTTVANEVYFGKSVTLTPNVTYSADLGDVTATTDYNVEPNNGATVKKETNTFEVPKSVGADATSSIAYTVTYTVTLSNGESDSASVTITAKDSTEQTAYKALLAGLGTATYPDPSTYTGKTAATVAAYKTAYDAAVTVKDAGYPDAEGTAEGTTNTAAKSALDDAKSKLADKTSLPTPVLAVEGGNNTVAYGDTVNLYVSNESTGNYPNTMTYSLYNSSDNKVADFDYGQKVTIPSSFLAVGENGFYVIAATNDTDNYNMSNIRSATITVNVVEMVKVSVSAGENGTAYISKYYDVNDTEQTSTNLTSVTVKMGTDVTFTAEPNSGYKIASWDGDTSKTGTNYTKTNVTAVTTVTVAFEEKPKVEFAVVGKLLNVDTTSGDDTHNFNNGIKFVDYGDEKIAVIDVDSTGSNWFAIADSNGNYYKYKNNEGNVDNKKIETFDSTNTLELSQDGITKPELGKVLWIGTTNVYRVHLIENDSDSTKINIWVESVSNPWRIYGDTTYGYFNKGWTQGASGDPIALSYKGNANQYYFPVEVTDPSNKIYFGLYFNSAAHQPSIANLEMVENTKYGNISTWTGYGNDKNFQINPDSTGTYYICVDTSTYQVWYEKAVTEPVPVSLTVNSTVEGGNASISSYTDNETGSVVTDTTETTVNAKPGTNVTFNADPVDGYYVKWTTSLDDTVTTGNTFTLSNVSGTNTITVTATYEKIETYNVTVKAQEGGSVSATLGETSQDVLKPISVKSTEVITLKATPNAASNYVFTGWEVTTNNYTLSGGTKINDAVIQVTPLADVTFTAMFAVQQGTEDNTYQLMLSNNDQGIPNDTTGSTVVEGLTFYKQTVDNVDTYSVTVPKTTFSLSNNNFFAFSTDGTISGVPQNTTAPTVKLDPESASYLNKPAVQEYGGKRFPYFSFKDASSLLSVKITYTPSSHTYVISAIAEAVRQDALDVYVANGNLADKGLKYGSSKIISGITEEYKKETSGSGYTKYRVKSGDKITVQCAMNDDMAKLGYYVYAFVVNGNKVDAVQSGKDVYQTATPVTITENTEITPVYYNTVIEANGDYVTLYVDAPDTLVANWGNSISIYSWYKNSGANMDGSYPGQLMMRDTQGKYVAKVAKYSYAKDAEGKFVRTENQNIAGITINNYYENQGSVHQQFLSGVQKHNGQSYDYNDFVKIAEMGYDTVEFDVKYFENTGTNADPISNQSALISNKTTLGTDPNNTTLSDTLHVTPYENLTNIDGNPVSILGYDDATIRTLQGNAGEQVTGLDKGNKLHIISVGNQNNKPNGGTAKWATCWYVYDPDGKYVTCGLPSDFIPSGSINADGKFVQNSFESQSEAYKAIVNAGLQYTSAEISYEVELDATKSVEKNTGVRVDGRWYYARSADTVAVDVGIIYKTDKNNTVWTVDQPSEASDITGKVTGGTASFSYTDSIGNTHTNLASGTVERNTVLSINATNGTTYKFIGWAVPTYDTNGNITGYTPLNLTDYNATYTVNTATKLYAMYEPYATGQLTLTHSKYVGADAHNGLGLFTIDAYLCDQNGNRLDSNDVATASVSDSVTLDVQNIPNAYVNVTLYTQSYAKSHFLNFYYPKVSNGEVTLTKDDNLDAYYDKECTADKKATNSFRVKVSDLFVGDKQVIMALNYYSDLKLPEVASNITFNYNPYNQAPSQSPAAGNGTGKTTFKLTITNNEGATVYTSNEGIGSLTLKGNSDLKDILADLTNGNQYTVILTLAPQADSHCNIGTTYRQSVDVSGNYTYTDATSDTGIWRYNSTEKTYSAQLSDLFDTTNQVFKSNTINFYTDFTADAFNYNVTFRYLGYESRQYYDQNGYTQTDIPVEAINKNWWKTYIVSGTLYGADIDKYFDFADGKYTFKEAFLLKVAPYEDNFVQSITWNLDNVVYDQNNTESSLSATVSAKYENGSVTVTAVLPEGVKEIYTVNYASLVTSDNYIGATKLPEGKTGYLIVAPKEYNDQQFSYWTIKNGNDVEVAKCYNPEFNYLAYDNYTVTACYGMDDVVSEKNKVSATMTFLEYSRNKYDTGDRVYADFAVSYNYNDKMLNANLNNNVVCGVAFVINKNYSSQSDATQAFTVEKADLFNKIKELNNSAANKTMSDGSMVYNYKINKESLDNKNRLEYSWNVNNSSNNQNLTILAYSYIYNSQTNEYSISEPETFKFYNVGNKTYKS